MRYLRRDDKVDLFDMVSSAPATASQSVAFAPPGASRSDKLGGAASLHDVLPHQDRTSNFEVGVLLRNFQVIYSESRAPNP